MGVETTDTISGLNENWPTGNEPKSEGDNHLRLLKHVLKKVFDDSTAGKFIIKQQGSYFGNLPGSDTGLAVVGDAIHIEKADGTLLFEIDWTSGAVSIRVNDWTGVKTAEVLVGAPAIDIVANIVRFLRGDGTQTRFNIVPDYAGTPGSVTMRVNKNDGTQENVLTMDKDGLKVTTGDFYQTNASVIRSRFGFDSVVSTAMKAYGTDGNLANMLALSASGLALWSVVGNSGAFKVYNNANGFIRGAVNFNSDGNAVPGLAQIIAYRNDGTRDQRLEIDAAGARLIDGNAAGDVLTTGNFPSKSGAAGNTDFPIGSHLLFTVPTGSEVNRSQPLVLRLNTLDGFSYRHTGTGTLLAGNWINSGINAAAQLGLGRRIS